LAAMTAASVILVLGVKAWVLGVLGATPPAPH
jgi:hypothetical protein